VGLNPPPQRAIGYCPITVTNPGVYFVDSVVVINPAR
jgi:hypothetical protein